MADAKTQTLPAAWRRDFLKFLAHVGRRPSPNHSLDRFPDPDRRLTGPQIIELEGIPRSCFYRRVERHGGSAEVAVAEWKKNNMGKKNLR